MGLASSALMPQTIIVSPCLIIADPSEVEIDPTEIDTGRKVVKLDLPSGLKPYNRKKLIFTRQVYTQPLKTFSNFQKKLHYNKTNAPFYSFTQHYLEGPRKFMSISSSNLNFVYKDIFGFLSKLQ